MRKLAFFVLSFSLAASSFAETNKPSLVVVISIDQFRYDYLERFAPWFSTGGFNRFLESGATFPDTHYLHAVTITGPGHATIGSGKAPAEHGIIQNLWFDRGPVDREKWDWYFKDSGGYEPPARMSDPALPKWFEQEKEGSPLYCVYDDSVTVSGGLTAGMSPHELIGEGLGDHVKDQYPGAHVIGISLKDRAAILMAGQKADAAYWFDPALPGFVSDSYYHYDPKLFAFNTTVEGYIPGSHAWSPAPYIPATDLQRVTFDPPAAWPLKNTKYGGTFPHPIKDAKAMTYTPYASDMLADFALWTIENESLGSRTTTPDVLFVSFSSTDYFGHYYGPDSMEAADGVVRLDRTIERFLNVLDRRFGDRVVVALTADHGVQSTPEILKLKQPNADAGRVDFRNPYSKGQRISDLPPQRIDLERRLAKRLGTPFSADAQYSHAIVYFFEEPMLYLNEARIRELKLNPERVKRALRDIVRNVPGVDGAWTDTEIRAGHAPHSVRISYLEGRSGDLFVTLKQNWIWSWGSNSTTHGQPIENDTHVPLLFWGADIKPGRYDTPASPEDLARTLGAILGVQAGGAEAHLLPCLDNAARVTAADEESLVKRSLLTLDPSGKTTRENARVGKIEIDGENVTVRIWTGQPPKPAPPGTMSLDCGTSHVFTYQKKNGDWVLVGQGISMC